jgi:hypothetical protein
MTEMNQPIDIAAIKARCETATLGRWHIHRYSVEDENSNHICGDFGHGHEENKIFIAHAREDIPGLLAEVERLTREKDELREAMKGAQAITAIMVDKTKDLTRERDAAVNDITEILKTIPDLSDYGFDECDYCLHKKPCLNDLLTGNGAYCKNAVSEGILAKFQWRGAQDDGKEVQP